MGPVSAPADAADLAAAAAIVEVRATTANAPHLRDLANRVRALAETLNLNSTLKESK